MQHCNSFVLVRELHDPVEKSREAVTPCLSFDSFFSPFLCSSPSIPNCFLTRTVHQHIQPTHNTAIVPIVKHSSSLSSITIHPPTFTFMLSHSSLSLNRLRTRFCRPRSNVGKSSFPCCFSLSWSSLLSSPMHLDCLFTLVKRTR